MLQSENTRFGLSSQGHLHYQFRNRGNHTYSTVTRRSDRCPHAGTTRSSQRKFQIQQPSISVLQPDIILLATSSQQSQNSKSAVNHPIPLLIGLPFRRVRTRLSGTRCRFSQPLTFLLQSSTTLKIIQISFQSSRDLVCLEVLSDEAARKRAATRNGVLAEPRGDDGADRQFPMALDLGCVQRFAGKDNISRSRKRREKHNRGLPSRRVDCFLYFPNDVDWLSFFCFIEISKSFSGYSFRTELSLATMVITSITPRSVNIYSSTVVAKDSFIKILALEQRFL